MAAFPPPVLNLHIPEPLRDLFRMCETHVWGEKEVGLENFEPEAWPIAVWLRTLSGECQIETLNQFEHALNLIHRQRGGIESEDFYHHWQTPYDCLLYFAEWRREIAAAVRQIPAFFDPCWLTPDVTGLRDAIRGQRAFDRLPVLADALEEAGCDHPLILNHLREPADHAHHCWVIDLLAHGR